VIKKVTGKLFDGILIFDFQGACNKIETLATQRGFYHLFMELQKVDKLSKPPDWKRFRKKLGRLRMDVIRLGLRRTQLKAAVFDRRKTRIAGRLDKLIASPCRDMDVIRLVKRLIRHRD
jgi:hypothetical protein